MERGERGNQEEIRRIGVSMTETPYRLWEEDEKYFLGFKSLFTPKCMICGTNMTLWKVYAQNFAINDGTDEKNSHALDIVLWCPECALTNIFGLAFSKEQYELIAERLKDLDSKQNEQGQAEQSVVEN